MPEPANDPETLRRRVLYRASHRGTKEMDWLLGRYAQAKVPDMTADELSGFEEFLALPDPEIQNWLLTPGQALPEGLAGDFVQQLKQFHEL